ncbi:MAG: DNA polymerase domain-containing protein [Bacteroidota bacterium]
MTPETNPKAQTPRPTADQHDVALFGKSNTREIVAVHPVTDKRNREASFVRVYSRDVAQDKVTSSDAQVYPFFFLSTIDCLHGFPRARYQYQELGGDNFYRYLVVFKSWNAYWDAIRHVEQTTNQKGRTPDELYLVTNPVQQYLMQTGETCFKGMPFEALHRMQLDIEVYSEAGFPNAKRAGDEIIIIALSDNRGWEKLLHSKNSSEKAILEELVAVIQDKDPDVIEGHNIFAFDFMYLMERYRKYRIPFRIGRDQSEPRTYPSSMRFAERSIDFPALQIAGRHVVDTYFQVMSYDVFKRDLPGYGLKVVAKYFGFAPEDRTYVEGDKIAETWRTDPDLLLRYALDDVRETERLARHLSGSTFHLTRMLPMPYGQVARTGPAAKIESLFVREYLRQKQALPKSTWGSQTLGGYTDVFLTGVTGPIVYADVESLYPSIMLNYNIQPAQDHLGLFPYLLRRLTDLRFESKNGMKTAETEEERSELDARQSSYKVLINSFYGNLGFSHAAFNDFAEADRVASIGQQILRKIIALLDREKATVIEVDTDGVLFTPPDTCRGEAAERAFLEKLNKEMPAGIRIGFDGRFKKMLSYKKKNYALLTYEEQLKFKGSSLVSRSNERFGRDFVAEAIRLLLDEDVAGLHALYLATRDKIVQHAWQQVQEFSKTETLKDTITRYKEDVLTGKRTRAASYELALKRQQASGQPVKKGDRISYYIAGTGLGSASFELAKLADEWSPDQPDENTAYYLKRLDEFARKFEPFFTDTDFRLIFSPEDLFGFDPSGIKILSHYTAPQHLETDTPF